MARLSPVWIRQYYRSASAEWFNNTVQTSSPCWSWNTERRIQLVSVYEHDRIRTQDTALPNVAEHFWRTTQIKNFAAKRSGHCSHHDHIFWAYIQGCIYGRRGWGWRALSIRNLKNIYIFQDLPVDLPVPVYGFQTHILSPYRPYAWLSYGYEYDAISTPLSLSMNT